MSEKETGLLRTTPAAAGPNSGQALLVSEFRDSMIGDIVNVVSDRFSEESRRLAFSGMIGNAVCAFSTESLLSRCHLLCRMASFLECAPVGRSGEVPTCTRIV